MYNFGLKLIYNFLCNVLKIIPSVIWTRARSKIDITDLLTIECPHMVAIIIAIHGDYTREIQ